MLDTNLLLLLVVGTYAVGHISVHKRTESFTADDYYILLELLAGKEIVVTTGVLTEASNLLWSGSRVQREALREILRLFITENVELLVDSIQACSSSEFGKLGLTDAGILVLEAQAGSILTADLDLHLAALARGLESENFTHYRTLL
ncbi:hypothetical protein [Pseudomonas viridiflava]|uniref:hypothetical protein n=1 Tax=Pseudomonas viridiflava TaxID=33069 RepID=UPI000C0712F9|nr:hypothetical protein [Pseudomonas viridiflava]